MNASELPVGARFTLAGSTDDTVYIVTHQVPGLMAWTHLTYTTFGAPFGSGSVIASHAAAWAGHTEVIAHPDTRAVDSTPTQ